MRLLNQHHKNIIRLIYLLMKKRKLTEVQLSMIETMLARADKESIQTIQDFIKDWDRWEARQIEREEEREEEREDEED